MTCASVGFLGCRVDVGRVQKNAMTSNGCTFSSFEQDLKVSVVAFGIYQHLWPRSMKRTRQKSRLAQQAIFLLYFLAPSKDQKDRSFNAFRFAKHQWEYLHIYLEIVVSLVLHGFPRKPAYRQTLEWSELFSKRAKVSFPKWKFKTNKYNNNKYNVKCKNAFYSHVREFTFIE